LATIASSKTRSHLAVDT